MIVCVEPPKKHKRNINDPGTSKDPDFERKYSKIKKMKLEVEEKTNGFQL